MSESSNGSGRYDGTEIAICGLSGRFPGAPDVESLWRNLCEGVESITRFSPDELRDAGEDPERIEDPRYVPARPVLDGADLFDASFFGLNPREAEILDPQHRVFLEVAWEALESAGCDTARFEGAVSLFAGATFSSYLVHNLYKNRPVMESFGDMLSTIQNVPDSLVTMAAYKLGLKGACCAVQTFCSSSLVGVHLACQSLLNYESDVALAGGVSIYVPQTSGYLHEEGSILSREGRCRAFDARADGTLFGNGVGVVVLRRLEDALESGDPIRAVILGSAINNDGAVKASFAAPAVVGQTEVVVEALASAGVSAHTITCVEAHGTGTPLGDPAEVNALTKAYRTATDRRGFCALGSVKSNIGHLDAAAGVTGLIKMVLALQHRQIPPSLHFETPNPDLDLDSSPFFVNTSLREWEAAGGSRRAGVSAFGVGGTNAHVVLEEAPPAVVFDSMRPAQLLVVSARSEAALERATLNLAHHIESHPELSLADVAWTLQVGRRAFDRRWAAVCHGPEDALGVLRGQGAARVVTREVEHRNPPVVLLFAAGPASFDLFGELSSAEPRLRDETERGLEAAGARASEIRSVLDGAAVSPGGPLATAGQLIVQHALARLVLSWGVRPEALVAEGSGVHAARVVAGSVDLPTAVKTALEGSTGAPAAAGEPSIPLVSRGALDADQSRAIMAITSNPTTESVLTVQRSLWLAGVDLDWGAAHAPERRKRVPLPTYPFERERYWVDPLPEDPKPVPVAPGPADWLYRPFWKSALPPAATEKVDHLVFLTPDSLGSALAERLRKLGDDVVTVEPGPAFAGNPVEGYVLDPARAEDYSRLWDDLRRHGRQPRSLVHTWSVDVESMPDDPRERFEAASRLGFDSVRFLARATSSSEGGLALRVVADGFHAGFDDAALRPELAPLVGLLRVLPQEHEGLRCVAVDADLPSRDSRVVEALAWDVRSSPTGPVVALRHGARWVQSFERLEGRPTSAGLAPRKGGVYLVTGGLGSVGFAHAVALARRAPAKFVLTARSALPPREAWSAWIGSHEPTETTALRIRRVQLLESLGSEVMAVAADVADEPAMAALLERVGARFGALNGLVHAAGELAPETFERARELSSEACARQFAPKIQGLLVLDRLLQGQTLDFVLLTSSLSTVLGGYGYAAYAGANAFLDAFAASRSRIGGTPWVSVDWDKWAAPEKETRETDAPALEPRQGLAVIEGLFARLDVGRLVVSVTPLEPRLQRWVDLDDPAGSVVDGEGAEASSLDPTPAAVAMESALLEHEAIQAAAVIAPEHAPGLGSLTAYVTFGRGAEPTVTELRSWLRPRLPEGARVPSFVILDALPVSADGEVDRARLAGLDGDARAGLGSADRPRTETELLVAGIWQDTLGRGQITVHDNFFDLGGHSLLSVRVVTRIEKELGVRLDPQDLIFQTLEQVAAACETRVRAVGERA